jgi:hypothetical protein
MGFFFFDFVSVFFLLLNSSSPGFSLALWIFQFEDWIFVTIFFEGESWPPNSFSENIDTCKCICGGGEGALDLRNVGFFGFSY